MWRQILHHSDTESDKIYGDATKQIVWRRWEVAIDSLSSIVDEWTNEHRKTIVRLVGRSAGSRLWP